MMKFSRRFSGICIIILLYSSCAKKENYPDVPVITYNSFIPFCSGSTTDSAYLRINFTDGNGAIGYPQSDTSAPPDCFIVPMIYNTTKGIFEVLTYTGAKGTDTLIFPYIIPDITPAGKDKELNGIIQINMETFIQQDISILNGLLPGHDVHKLQFKVWIYDRANNKSNVLITPTVYTCGE